MKGTANLNNSILSLGPIGNQAWQSCPRMRMVSGDISGRRAVTGSERSFPGCPPRLVEFDQPENVGRLVNPDEGERGPAGPQQRFVGQESAHPLVAVHERLQVGDPREQEEGRLERVLDPPGLVQKGRRARQREGRDRTRDGSWSPKSGPRYAGRRQGRPDPSGRASSGRDDGAPPLCVGKGFPNPVDHGGNGSLVVQDHGRLQPVPA